MRLVEGAPRWEVRDDLQDPVANDGPSEVVGRIAPDRFNPGPSFLLVPEGTRGPPS
jgi:hypothetical protein